VYAHQSDEAHERFANWPTVWVTALNKSLFSRLGPRGGLHAVACRRPSGRLDRNGHAWSPRIGPAHAGLGPGEGSAQNAPSDFGRSQSSAKFCSPGLDVCRILFCTDFSDDSPRALEYALSLALQYNAELSLLTSLKVLVASISSMGRNRRRS
jgi:hypothetical protein